MSPLIAASYIPILPLTSCPVRGCGGREGPVNGWPVDRPRHFSSVLLCLSLSQGEADRSRVQPLPDRHQGAGRQVSRRQEGGLGQIPNDSCQTTSRQRFSPQLQLTLLASLSKTSPL